jgi:prepilin-type N-terminal cleavage/methylation domain-containing protein
LKTTPPFRSRFRGLTLIEIMVVLGMMGVISLLAAPALSGLLGLNQRAAAKELAQTYTWLMDEAALRNVTFRVVYNLDARTWKIEAGDPGTLVFGTPEDREKFDEELESELKRFTKRELEEGKAQGIKDKRGRFEGLEGTAFTTEKELPGGAAFAYVYTPQYGEDGLRPHKEGPPEDAEDHRVAYTYVFPDGTAEHTVVRIVDEDDPESGWTIEVWPMSGEVHVSTDLVDPETSLDWIPEEAPEIN